MYLSLARKYRPKTFASVAVQSHVSNTLKGAIARGRVAHGYLLCGPRGVGKTTLARVLAMALNCERRARGDAGESGEPCGECVTCQRIWSGAASLDVVEIDAASNRGVDDARELRERAMYAPSTQDHYKVYIVDEAHMLTREAWNALLKILEEPPPRVVFVFATTEPQKIAQAAAPVLSRLQRFDFKRMSPADVRARLSEVLAAENVAAEPEALAMLSRAADGSMRDALSLADQALALGDGSLTAERVRDALGLVPEEEYLRVLDLILDARAADIFSAVGRLVDEGADLLAFLGGFTDLLRGQLALALGGDIPELSERTREALRERAGRLSSGDLLRMLSAVTAVEPLMRRSGQQRVLLESLLLRFALMDRTIVLEDVLRSLGGEGGGDPGEEGARPRATRPPAAPAPRADASRVRSGERVSPPPPAVEPKAASPATARAAGGPAGGGPPPLDPDSAPWLAGSGGSGQGADGGAAVAVAPPVTLREPLPAPEPRHPPEPLDANRLAERWGEVVAAIRATRRSMLASALEHVSPVAVTAGGDITLELDEPLEMFVQAIEGSAGEITAAISTLFSGTGRVRLSRPSGPATSPAPSKQRLTEAAARGERLALLCRRDPLLAAAVHELDLELID